MRTDDETQGQWKVALEDAGDPDDVVLTMIAELSAGQQAGNTGCWYFPAGAPLQVDPPIPLTADERAQLMSVRDRPRVVIVGGMQPKLQLAAMRWTLELDRQHRYNAGIPAFGNLVNAAFDPLVEGPGRAGSGVVYNCLPHIKDADLAAAHLVTDRYGPQTGQLYGRYGAMFRTTDGEPNLETLPARLVVAAAVAAENVDGGVAEIALRGLDPDALEWWQRLRADADFTHLRKSLRFYRPSPELVAELQELDGQAQAWRPWAFHFGLCLQHGLDLIQ